MLVEWASMATVKKYTLVSFRPPPEVAVEAAEGLALRREFGRGGTRVGIARARDLKNRRNLSPSTIKRMVSYFARHEVDKRGTDWNNAQRPSNGRIAWLLWGGDSGRSWATNVVEQMKRADKLQ